MQRRTIKKIAVLGSGIMGSRIACHMANAGFEVVLLDIVPKEADKNASSKERNALVNKALAAALKSNPAPLYSNSQRVRNLITTGNFEDDMALLSDCDWICEAVIERLDIKHQVFEQVEKFRKPGSLVSTNTSGIPVNLMLKGRSEDFKQHFCGTHFFNPPRYLKLLEIIPAETTLPEVIDFLMHFGNRILGKTTVLCKDTPAFIANRVGVYSIMSLFHAVEEMGLSVDEVDKLTGPVLGRPKSATFRTCDVVGLDTLVHVANGLKENCPNDEAKHIFEMPSYIQKMVENAWLGSKTKQGFYKKSKDVDGNRQILSLDLSSMEYVPKKKVKFATLEQAKAIDNLVERTKLLFNGTDKAGEFYRKTLGGLFAYVANRFHEISDDVAQIDNALKAGFGWELGPFETWDAVGLDKGVEVIQDQGLQLPAWISEMLQAKHSSFYKNENGLRMVYNPSSQSYQAISGGKLINITVLKNQHTLWQNKDASIIDLGDGVLNLEFHSKMNTIGGDTIQALNQAITMAEEDFKGLTVYNEGGNFSAGANVGMIFMLAVEQEWEELDFAIRAFQNAMMRVRYSSIPVVIAPHNMALGGSCEMSMHADKVIAHAETYMGLVEFGVGLIPGGGGTKEFALRLSDGIKNGDIITNQFRQRFLTIGQAKVSTSAVEAFELGYLRQGIDEWEISRDHQLKRAKEAVLELHDEGYVAPVKRKDILVYGQQMLGLVYVGANSFKSGNYMSDHDQLISEKLGYVLAGGDLSAPSKVSEDYLLKLERRAFLELCQERKTLERIQSILTKGKILRN